MASYLSFNSLKARVISQCEKKFQIARRTKWWKRSAQERKNNEREKKKRTKDLKVWIAYYR
jgi:hypothetical protein